MRHQIRSYYDSTFRNLIPLSDPWTNKDRERELAYSICSKVFKNIHDFPFIYFINGITEGINHYASNFKIIKHRSDYRYLDLVSSNHNNGSEIFYQSFPFSGDGKFHSIKKDKPVVLDCAYLFCSNLNYDQVIPDNVDSVMFSLSKSHNLPDYRIAWMFCKNKINQYHVLQYDNNYGINSFVLPALELIQTKPLNFLYLKYKNEFSKLYSSDNLIEGDVNLFALTSKGDRIPFYVL